MVLPDPGHFPMTTTATLKLPERLKARIARLAKVTGRSPHSLNTEALERQVDRGERVRAFVHEAIASGKAVEADAEVYRADDVHAWLERLVRTPRAARPKPWHK